MSRKNKTERHRLLELACVDFGGQTAVAKALGVSQGLVNQWVDGRTRITEKRAMEIVHVLDEKLGCERAGRLRPDHLCPDSKWHTVQPHHQH